MIPALRQTLALESHFHLLRGRSQKKAGHDMYLRLLLSMDLIMDGLSLCIHTHRAGTVSYIYIMYIINTPNAFQSGKGATSSAISSREATSSQYTSAIIYHTWLSQFPSSGP